MTVAKLTRAGAGLPGAARGLLFAMRCLYRLCPALLGAGLLALTGCGTTTRTSSATAADTASEPERERELERRSRAHAHYAAAVVHDLQDENELALEEFFKAAQSDPDDEALALEVSKRLAQNKNYDKALAILLPQAEKPGASGSVFTRLGVIYSQMGEGEKAIAANQVAIKKMPGQLQGYQNLFLNYLAARQPQKALDLLDEAARQPDPGVEFLLGIAELYGNYILQHPTQRDAIRPKALAMLNRAEKLPMRASHQRFRLAEGFLLMGDTEQAAKAYLALLKNPDDTPILRDTARARLAEIYLRANDRKAAVQQLEAVVRDDPSNAQAYYFLGTLAYEDKQLTNAVEYLRKALLFGDQFDPLRHEQTCYDLALAQIALDDSAGALATLDGARKKFRARFVTEYLSGVASSQQKQFTNAVNFFSTAETLARANEPDRLDARFYFQAGAAAERTGDRGRAEKYFEKCIILAPDFSEALNYLGYMWAERGENLERAHELIQRALKAEPDNAAYLDSLGWVLFKQNKPAEALDYILKAVKLNASPDATLFDHLGDIYAALNQMDKAREFWAKSVAIEKNDAVQKKLDAPKPE